MQVLIIQGLTLPPQTFLHTRRLLEMPTLRSRKKKEAASSLQELQVKVHFEKLHRVPDKKTWRANTTQKPLLSSVNLSQGPL